MFIFVSDLFKKDYSGGAELTFDVLMNAIDLPKIQINSVNVSTSFMESNRDKIWIFGNYAQLSDACIIYAIKNLNYYLVEFDYKYCVERLEALCELKNGFCNCSSTSYGKLRAAFTGRSKAAFWMSQGQLDVWCERFPPLKNQNNIILSSAFSDDTLSKIQSLDTSGKDDKWIILGSQSWVKGKEESVEYAKKNNLNYDLVWGLPHDKLLEKLAKSKGLIQLPNGHDTCPRMVIEAKLLDCELTINHNVQHKDDDWFSGSNDEIIKYLRDRPSFFRDCIYSLENNKLPTTKQVDNEAHFSIIIPSFNNEKWIEKALMSVANQTYCNYDVYFIDDASTDNSKYIVQNFVSNLSEDLKSKFTLLFNKVNKKGLYNIVKAIELTRQETIIVLLDGDDRLSTPGVLAELAQIYKDENVWVTTGSYLESSSGRFIKSLKLSDSVWQTGIRKFKEPVGHPNIFSHLRSFRKWLYEKIDQEDLKENGQFYPCTFDRALMYPLVEMAGPDSHCVIEKAMYVYNTTNPISVHYTDRENQLRIEKLIRSLKPYDRVSKTKMCKNYFIKEGYQHRKEYIQNIQIGSKDKFQDEVYLKARQIFDDNKYTSILDIGCGSSYKLIKYFKDENFLGLELEPNLSWLKKRYPNYSYQLSDFNNPPEGEYDIVICSDVIEHLLEPDDILNFIKKINFKKLIISTPERDIIQKVQRRMGWSVNADGPPSNKCHIREWTREEFYQYISSFFSVQEHFIASQQEECQIVVAGKR